MARTRPFDLVISNNIFVNYEALSSKITPILNWLRGRFPNIELVYTNGQEMYVRCRQDNIYLTELDIDTRTFLPKQTIKPVTI